MAQEQSEPIALAEGDGNPKSGASVADPNAPAPAKDAETNSDAGKNADGAENAESNPAEDINKDGAEDADGEQNSSPAEGEEGNNEPTENSEQDGDTPPAEDADAENSAEDGDESNPAETADEPDQGDGKPSEDTVAIMLSTMYTLAPEHQKRLLLFPGLRKVVKAFWTDAEELPVLDVPSQEDYFGDASVDETDSVIRLGNFHRQVYPYPELHQRFKEQVYAMDSDKVFSRESDPTPEDGDKPNPEGDKPAPARQQTTRTRGQNPMPTNDAIADALQMISESAQFAESERELDAYTVKQNFEGKRSNATVHRTAVDATLRSSLGSGREVNREANNLTLAQALALRNAFQQWAFTQARKDKLVHFYERHIFIRIVPSEEGTSVKMGHRYRDYLGDVLFLTQVDRDYDLDDLRCKMNFQQAFALGAGSKLREVPPGVLGYSSQFEITMSESVLWELADQNLVESTMWKVVHESEQDRDRDDDRDGRSNRSRNRRNRDDDRRDRDDDRSNRRGNRNRDRDDRRDRDDDRSNRRGNRNRDDRRGQGSPSNRELQSLIRNFNLEDYPNLLDYLEGDGNRFLRGWMLGALKSTLSDADQGDWLGDLDDDPPTLATEIERRK